MRHATPFFRKEKNQPTWILALRKLSRNLQASLIVAVALVVALLRLRRLLLLLLVVLKQPTKNVVTSRVVSEHTDRLLDRKKECGFKIEYRKCLGV
jgi:hypothetical protein